MYITGDRYIFCKQYPVIKKTVLQSGRLMLEKTGLMSRLAKMAAYYPLTFEA